MKIQMTRGCTANSLTVDGKEEINLSDNERLEALSPSQITAYCLHEITFFGFTEEQRKRQEASLDESIKEAKEHQEVLPKILSHLFRMQSEV